MIFKSLASGMNCVLIVKANGIPVPSALYRMGITWQQKLFTWQSEAEKISLYIPLQQMCMWGSKTLLTLQFEKETVQEEN